MDLEVSLFFFPTCFTCWICFFF